MQHTQRLTNNKKVRPLDWNTLRLEAYKLLYASGTKNII